MGKKLDLLLGLEPGLSASGPRTLPKGQRVNGGLLLVLLKGVFKANQQMVPGCTWLAPTGERNLMPQSIGASGGRCAWCP